MSAPRSNRLLGPYYVGIEEMVWPSVTREVRHLEWKLRYARESLTKTECLVLASIVSAYAQMVGDPQTKRNRVCREIRANSDANRRETVTDETKRTTHVAVGPTGDMPTLQGLA